MQPTDLAPPPPPTPSRDRPLWPWIALIAALAMAAGIVGTLAVQKLHGGGPAASASPSTFTVHGAIDLVGAFGAGGQSCDLSRRPGASDLAPGGQVVVYDNAGRSLAIGTLAEGALQPGGTCRMLFTVTGVPDGPGPFFVEVTHRGRIAFTRAQASFVPLSLNLP
jgi:hypothetical protein